MRKFVYRLFIIQFLFLVRLFDGVASASTDTLMNSLLKHIQNKEAYAEQKKNYLLNLKKKLADSAGNIKPTYEIQRELYNIYISYESDSAIVYAKKNVNLAIEQNMDFWRIESQLDLATFYLTGGMYLDADSLLRQIKPTRIDHYLRIKYFDTKQKFYRFYAFQHLEHEKYIALSDSYRDSLLSILDTASNHFKMVYSEKLIDQDKSEEAKKIIFGMIKSIKEDTHEKAMLAYSLANVYKKEDNLEKQRMYYIISAICDIKNAIKENASSRALASLLYKMGDIEGAYACIRSSMEDAKFCNARFRSYEASQIYPIIEASYQDNEREKRKILGTFLVVASILSALLVTAVIFVYRQKQRINRVRQELYSTNMKLREFNDKLHVANEELIRVNQEVSSMNKKLSEANQIKEVYIGHFLDLCATYIDKLERYQSTIKKLIMGDKINQLLRLVKSHEMIDHEVQELYNTFDTTFLHLFPDFIGDFNSLLRPEERIEVKDSEKLNTELRIFALIRLGISDTAKLASFLHYSLNTIYTYRAKVRNKAIMDKDEFDKMVMKIGQIRIT